MHGSMIKPPTRKSRRICFAVIVLALIMSAMPLRAEAPRLSLPIACTVGETCWLVNFVDHAPGPGVTDFRCGGLSYDGHKGTDIALRDAAAMADGVAILAAAGGIVQGVRDGMPASTPEDMKDRTRIRGRECGNGVVIDHGDGWTTQYCHMKAGTLAVARGSKVAAGDRLGDVGQSGLSEFPHMHITLRHNGTVIDPFTGGTEIDRCVASESVQGLWAKAVGDALAYPGPQIYHAGFAVGVPAVDDVRAGRLSETRLDAAAPALVFWAEAFSTRAGDTVTLTLTGPGGDEVARTSTVLDRAQARILQYAGRKRRGAAWSPGLYTGTMKITRDGQSAARLAAVRID